MLRASVARAPRRPGAITFHQRYKQVVIHRPGRHRLDGSPPARVTAKNENLKRARCGPRRSVGAPVFNAQKGRSHDGRLLVCTQAGRGGGVPRGTACIRYSLLTPSRRRRSAENYKHLTLSPPIPLRLYTRHTGLTHHF